LIVPDFVFLHNWCFLHKVKFRESADLIEHPKVIERYQREVDLYNAKLDRVSQIKVFKLICENWTPESGELSPTLKLKRKVVMKKYHKKIAEIYASKD